LSGMVNASRMSNSSAMCYSTHVKAFAADSE
jgi:hypothetical protein